jgi:hypothetical protein
MRIPLNGGRTSIPWSAKVKDSVGAGHQALGFAHPHRASRPPPIDVTSIRKSRRHDNRACIMEFEWYRPVEPLPVAASPILQQ